MTTINRLVFVQGDGKGKGEGRWWWYTLDTRNQRPHGSERATSAEHSSEHTRPRGWHTLRRAQDNAEGVLGAEVELIMVRGEYAHGQVHGRDITVKVVR